MSQALHLNNGHTLNDKLRDKNSVVEQWNKEKIGGDEAIRRTFSLAFSREPRASEMANFKNLMVNSAKDKRTTRREVLEDLFWGVLSGKEFLFNR